MKFTHYVLVCLLNVGGMSLTYAVDADSDGSDAVEEALAGTSDNDTSMRPYWWRTFNGDSEGDYLGYSVSGTGDVNNDGYADFIAGAYNDDNNGSNSGSARVYSGVDGSILYAVNGDSPNDYLGVSVSGAGDVNNDGYDDFIIGAFGDDNNGLDSGSMSVYSGVDGSILYTVNGDSSDDLLGFSGSGAGDVNGDGYADFIVGSPRDDNNGDNSGSFQVYSGIDGSILYAENGETSGDLLGALVSGSGDVNNDGYADFIVGGRPEFDNNDNTSGYVRVYSGVDGSVLYIFNGDFDEDRFGYSASNAGDINNDDYDDIIIGAYLDAAGRGSARVYSGIDGSVLYTVYGDDSDRLGVSVSAAGDINNDGYGDFIAGAYLDGKNGVASGSVNVYSGLDGNLLYAVSGDGFADELGWSVSGVGDVDNDGYDDIIAGAYKDDNGGIDSGSVRVYLGWNLMNDNDLDFIVNNIDTDDDNDSMPDSWEIAYGLNPLVANGASDFDGDGLTNLQEYTRGKNPSVINHRMPLCDFDKDIDTDILLRNDANGSWRRFDIQNGEVSSNANMSGLYVNTGWSAQACFDANGDGDDDILLRNTSSGAWRLFTVQNGTVQSNANANLYQNTDYIFQGVMDIDADSDEDVILRHKTTGKWRVFLMSDGNVDSNQGLDVYMNPLWDFVFAEDLDNDGDDDVVLRNSSTGVWRKFIIDFANGGQGSMDTHEGFNAYQNTGWRFEFAGDLDSDGDADVVLRNSSIKAWRAFYTVGGDLTLNAALSLDRDTEWQFRGVGDVDQDGDSDVVLRNSSDGSWKIYTIHGGTVTGDSSLGLYSNTAWTLFE